MSRKANFRLFDTLAFILAFLAVFVPLALMLRLVP